MSSNPQSTQQSSPNTIESIKQKLSETIKGTLTTSSPFEDRCIGCLLAGMCGDILGAAAEGYTPKQVENEFGELRSFVPSYHMGANHFGKRYGMYTDDTNSMLALATSLVDCQGLDPKYTARMYVKFYDTIPTRGYPDSALAVLNAIRKGTDYRKTGTMIFKDGSYANGGAMRIAPIGLVYSKVSDKELYQAVKMAIISSHVHPEAIDGAFMIAKAVSICVNIKDPKQFDPKAFLKTLKSLAKTKNMKSRITILIDEFSKLDPNIDRKSPDNFKLIDKAVISKIAQVFQISSVECVACVLWAVARYWQEPENAIIKSISFGGDTDTVALQVGVILGALWGWEWIPKRWFDNIENGTHGRDYCIKIAREISKMNVTKFQIVESKKELVLSPVPIVQPKKENYEMRA